MSIFQILVLFLITFYSPAFADNTAKQNQWDAMAAEVNQWTDGLGKPIDAGIKEAVIALNLLGFKTRQSCEGHLDHGYPYPWVDFDLSSLEIDLIREEFRQLNSKIKNEENNRSCDQNLLTSLRHQLFDIHQKLSRAIDKSIEPLHLALEKFYRNHSCAYENMLLVNKHGLIIVLESNGADRFLSRTPSENKQKMSVYRKEMKDFADFLKQGFLNDSL